MPNELRFGIAFATADLADDFAGSSRWLSGCRGLLVTQLGRCSDALAMSPPARSTPADT